jgi:hypothetical protein
MKRYLSSFGWFWLVAILAYFIFLAALIVWIVD